MNSKSGKVWRIIAIVFMGLTAAMNILGGAGTVCAAFLTKKYPPMWVFMDYQWLYQILMITTIIIGVAGIWSTVGLARGGKDVYKWALNILIIGTILGGTQYFASLAIRGEAVPANVKFFTNIAALILFLLLKLPGIRDKVDFSKPSSKSENAMSGGLAAFISRLVVLTVFIWAGPSHTYMGENWVEKFTAPILISGILLTVGGLLSIGWGISHLIKEEAMEVKPFLPDL